MMSGISYVAKKDPTKIKIKIKVVESLFAPNNKKRMYGGLTFPFPHKKGMFALDPDLLISRIKLC